MDYCPKVSIIIPVYNGSNFMAEAIDSALAQTYPHCEVIVVNDGSTDNGASEEIALSYGDKIRYFRKENGGVSSALNFAFEKMTGEWFSWLSHDDLYYPQKIEKQVLFLNRLMKEKPDVDLKKITVRSATESIDKDGKVIRTPNYRNVPECEDPIDTIINNVYHYRLSGCSFLLPSSCIQDVGPFDESIRTVSDVEYWYRLLFSGYTFYCLSGDVLVKNRSHGKQVGKTKVSLFEQELNQLHIAIAERFASTAPTTELIKRFYLGLAYRRMHTATLYFRKNHLRSIPAIEYYIQIPLCSFGQSIKGSLRTILRYIYRLVRVK